MKKRLKTHQDFKRELLQDPEVLQAYEDYAEEFHLLDQMLKARKKSGLSQAEIAKKMHTTASAVSRLESLGVTKRPSPSFNTLKKYAHALGCRLSIKLVPEST